MANLAVIAIVAFLACMSIVIAQDDDIFDIPAIMKMDGVKLRPDARFNQDKSKVRYLKNPDIEYKLDKMEFVLKSDESQIFKPSGDIEEHKSRILTAVHIPVKLSTMSK